MKQKVQSTWQQARLIYGEMMTDYRKSIIALCACLNELAEECPTHEFLDHCAKEMNWSRRTAFRWKRTAAWVEATKSIAPALILDGLPTDMLVIDLLSAIPPPRLMDFAASAPEAFDGRTHSREEWQAWIATFLGKVGADANGPADQLSFFEALNLPPVDTLRKSVNGWSRDIDLIEASNYATTFLGIVASAKNRLPEPARKELATCLAAYLKHLQSET